MDLFAVLISIVIWALVFSIAWWGLNTLTLQEPFHKVIRIILVVMIVIILIGLLTGRISPFTVLI